MRYEQEIIQLIPMLKSYIRKLSRGFTNDDEDILQECMVNALSVDRDDLRDPRNYLIGVCARTICKHRSREILHKRLDGKYRGWQQCYDEIDRIPIMERLESRITKAAPKQRRVWSALKLADGDARVTSKILGMHIESVRLIRRELRAIYREECEK